MDRVVVGIMSDAEALGVYQVASQLAMIVIVLRSAVTLVFETSVAKIGQRPGGQGRRHERVLRRRAGSCSTPGPGLVVLALTAASGSSSCSGLLPAAAPALVILAAGQLAVTFAGPSVTALHMTGKRTSSCGADHVGLPAQPLGNVALIPVRRRRRGGPDAGSPTSPWPSTCLRALLARTGRLRFSRHWLDDVVFGTWRPAQPRSRPSSRSSGELSIVEGASRWRSPTRSTPPPSAWRARSTTRSWIFVQDASPAPPRPTPGWLDHGCWQHALDTERAHESPSSRPARPASKVRILHSVGHLIRGGIEHWLYDVVQRLDPGRFEHHVMVWTEEEEAFTADFQAAGARCCPAWITPSPGASPATCRIS